jgi:hypothetical protein
MATNASPSILPSATATVAAAMAASATTVPSSAAEGFVRSFWQGSPLAVVYCQAMLALASDAVIQWWPVVLIIVGGVFAWKTYGGTALTTVRVANEVLERRVRDLEQESRHDKAEIAELRGRTDVTVAIGPLLTWTTEHELRAQERHSGIVNVLELIASRLGPDANGVR